MHASVVVDAGGLLALAGLVEAVAHEVDEICALDASALLAAEYLAVRHEGAPARATSDFGLAVGIVREWFPVRPFAMDAALSPSAARGDIEPAAALLLAEALNLPLVTKNQDLSSRRVPVLRA